MLVFSLVAMAVAAEPGEVRLGVDVGAVLDMPDATSREYAQFGPGGTLGVPLRIGLTENARLIASFRGEFATGSDRVTWALPVQGQTVTFYDDEHFAMPVVGALTAGAEVVLPTSGTVEIALSVDTGAAWVGTYHSFSGPTQLLLDPDSNDLSDAQNVDPYTTQVAWISGAAVRLAVPFGEDLHLTVATGYSGAFLKARSLQKTPAALDARRAAYGWNPLRLTIGIEQTL